MKSKQLIKIVYVVLVYVVSVPLMSCTDENMSYPLDKGKKTIIRFTLPEQASAPLTKTMPADQSTINTIDVLSFIVDPASANDMTKGTFFYQAATLYTAGQNWFSVTLSQHHQNQTLVILVNSRQALQNINISPGESKASVMEKLVQAQNTAFNSATMTQIPMWGHIANQTINDSYSVPGIIKLVRMLARINIVNNEADFNLKTAYLYNPREKGSYIPNNWDEVNTTVFTPTQPVGAIMPIGANFMYSTDTNNFLDKIFTFEADNQAQSAISTLNSTCIVVGGDYTDARGTNTYYYRIDLKQPGTETFYNVLRNHSYNITINDIKRAGTNTPDQAYRGLAYIDAAVEDWKDMSGNVTIDGSNHLKVSQNFIFFDRGVQTVVSTENKITIQSTSSWQIADYPIWAVPNQQTGAAGSTSTVSIIATASGTNRQGTMKIIAGNLTYTVHLLQADCGMNGFTLRQKIGSNTYRTYRYGIDCWMVENSREGASSSTMFDTHTGKTNGYYYTYSQASATANGACPAGWTLPTETHWSSLRTLAQNDLEVGGKWWLGKIGFLNNAYAGYYDTDSGWVEWGESGIWWMKGTETSYIVSYYGRNQFLSFDGGNANHLFSVRCIKN